MDGDGSSNCHKTVNWDQLRIFLTVADADSFTQASKLLNLSQSAVSRRVTGLEQALNLSLFHRYSGRNLLTEPGIELQRRAREMSARLNLALTFFNEFREIPSGPLRITTSESFGSGWLSPRINKFRQQYPDINVSLLLVDDKALEPSMDQADVAIRFEPQSQANLVQRRITSICYHVFASAKYLAKYGTPKTLCDLNDHKLIGYGEDIPAPVSNINWLLSIGRPADTPREAAMLISNDYGIYRAIKSGLGIAALPSHMADEMANLVRILPNLEGPTIDAYLVYPEELRRSKRISVLREFLIAELDGDKGCCHRTSRMGPATMPSDIASRPPTPVGRAR